VHAAQGMNAAQIKPFQVRKRLGFRFPFTRHAKVKTFTDNLLGEEDEA